MWTLAFDAEGHLLGGGSTLIRISPGADGLVNGSVDETAARIAGIPGANIVGYPEPYSGDGLPALEARLVFTYQMAVAADGAVVFTDENHRIRRIAPGADGVVNGGPGEIVRTVAGFFSGTGAAPSGYATSYYGNFRGLVEDPLNPGSFIVSSHGGHQLLRFGIAPTGEEPPPPPGPAMVDIPETITVDDGIAVQLSVMLEVIETIAVDDGLTVLPSAMLEILETIAVDDGLAVLPSAMLEVIETIAVDDGIAVTATPPPAPVQLAITTVFRRDAAGNTSPRSRCVTRRQSM